MSGAQIKIREKKRAPGRYQRLDFFIKVLRVLCPNLPDASMIRNIRKEKKTRCVWKESWTQEIIEKDEERAALKEIENKQLFLGSSFYYWNVGEENKKRLTVDSRNEIRLTKETRIKLYCQPPVSSLTTFPLLGFFHLVTARH